MAYRGAVLTEGGEGGCRWAQKQRLCDLCAAGVLHRLPSLRLQTGHLRTAREQQRGQMGDPRRYFRLLPYSLLVLPVVLRSLRNSRSPYSSQY